MSFEPQKFFIGLIDFFAILLPGALLTFFVKDSLGVVVLGKHYAQLSDKEGSIGFLFSSYLLGHFIFLLGSWLLDDGVYDKIRKATTTEQIKRLAHGGKASAVWASWLAKHWIKPVSDHALYQVVALKEAYLKPLHAADAINAFQWCKARLAIEQPHVLESVQRFEADSKFFRSLLLVLAALIPIGLAQGQYVLALLCIPLLLLSLWRYVDQRNKAINQAYWYLITLEASSGKAPIPSSSTPAGHFTHAGGVVFRQVKKKIEYLLVQATERSQEWVLPKGHIEPGETTQETAVREVHEETGIWARIIAPLEVVEYEVKGKPIRIQFYLMEAQVIGKSKEKRKPAWQSLKTAITKASHEETRDLFNKLNAEHSKHTMYQQDNTGE